MQNANIFKNANLLNEPLWIELDVNGGNLQRRHAFTLFRIDALTFRRSKNANNTYSLHQLRRDVKLNIMSMEYLC